MELDKKTKRLIRHCTNLCGSNDPFKIATHLGIHISRVPLGNIAGIYKYVKRGKWIFLNTNIDDEIFGQMVMAHELGHALLHPKENCCFMAHHTLLLTSRTERQANIFAAHLLIADDKIEEFRDFSIEQFSNCTGYQIEFLKLRLE